MRGHFTRKTVCPGVVNGSLELTEEIKTCVMSNRVYNEKKQSDVLSHIIIQNNQLTQVCNYFNKLDLTDKIELLDMKPQQCSDKVISMMERENRIHREDKPGLIIEDQDVQDMVGKLCRSQEDDLSDMNVLVDSKNNHMMIYEGDEWGEYDISSGTKQLLKHIHENFMCEHERYLLRIRNNSRCIRDRQEIKDEVVKYYKFVAAFDFEPYCYNKSDDDIYGNGSKDYSCEEEFYPRFKKVKESMTVSERKNWINLIVSTVKANAKMTMSMLNKKLYDLSQRDDPVFKRKLLKRE